MGRQCDYRGAPSAVPEGHRSQGDAVAEPIPNHFPPSFFLDPLLFRHYNLEVRMPKVPVPQEFLDVTGNTALVQSIASQYFSTIHCWFPFLSRTKFYGYLIHQSQQQECDLALLVMCVRLLCTPIDSKRSVQTAMYTRVKQYVTELESAGILKITVLQAEILLAVYEIAHAIYPAAYLTVGACARYGIALGLDKEGSRWEHNLARWIDNEEKHRAWWAVVFLDRYLNINSPKRSLSTKEPAEDWYLPVLDKNWNDGDFPSNPPYRLSAASDVEMGKFARLTQATHLLGRVLRHVSDTDIDPRFSREEKASLERALQSLLSLSIAEEELSGIHYCSPIGLTTR
ncbi:fungal-specific transcription factor domain-containing protein [Xylogone sp. PMI_703]|nr:fungal-specific transcription factor domain-containing protein [Xylogone sp. PMI_703]